MDVAPRQITLGNPQRKLFFGLFIFPLLIAVGMAALLCSVVLLTHEEETPESLITAIKTGSPSKRWQKAFELSNELNRGPAPIRNEGLMNEITHILSDHTHYDARTRAYMALALGHFRTPQIETALRQALSDESEDVQLYALWSLGTIGAQGVRTDVEKFLSDERPSLRKMAAYCLGVLGDPASAPLLVRLLEDPVTDVRWNAALALARLGSDAGAPTLLSMLNRQALANLEGLDESQTETVMVNALKGLSRVRTRAIDQMLMTLSKTDPSLKVRQSALEALKS